MTEVITTNQARRKIYGQGKFVPVFVGQTVADTYVTLFRTIERSENPGVPVLFGGHDLPPLVEISLTDLPKSGGAPPGITPTKNHRLVPT